MATTSETDTVKSCPKSNCSNWPAASSDRLTITTPTLNIATRTTATAASEETPRRASRLRNTVAAAAARAAPHSRPPEPANATPAAMPGKTACVNPSVRNSKPRKLTKTPTIPAVMPSVTSTITARTMKGMVQKLSRRSSVITSDRAPESQRGVRRVPPERRRMLLAGYRA